MKVFESSNVRNIALVGHQGAGKTMVSEAMLFATGSIARMGSIAEHNTVSDYHDSEHQREMSIFATLMHVERGETKVNLIDTPGYPDFMGEVVATLKVADTAVYVLNASDPIQVGTELAWGYGTKANIPALFLINHIDKGGIDFPAVIDKVQERFGRAATVLQLPVGNGSRAVIDLLMMKQLTFPEGRGDPQIADIPGGFKDKAVQLRSALVENVAENDEALMETYLDAGELTEEQLMKGLRAAVRARQLFPILVTSAITNVGLTRALDVIGACCPSPLDAHPYERTGAEPAKYDPAGEPVAFTFRTMSEQHVGDYFFLKVCSGAIENGMDLENADTRNIERLGGLFALNGRNRDALPKANAGDLVAVVKLKETRTNHTLRAKGSHVMVAPIAFPEPRYKAAIRASNPGEEDKLSSGLHKVIGEDPSLKIIHDPDLGQLLIGGQGEMHIEIAKFSLKKRYGVDVELSIPKVSYREAVQRNGRASYRHKKQTGGAGQFADISLMVEPLHGEYHPPPEIKVRDTYKVPTSWGANIEFIDAITGGVIDMKRFSGAIEKGVLDAMKAGPIAGYPCADVRVIIHDGKMHAVDSNENAFKTASRMGFKQAFEAATPVMLEPICDLEVFVPDAYTGDVMGDLNTRRARIQGMETEGGYQKIIAQAPEAELLRYSTILRSLSQGRGVHTARFHRYEPMPRNVQEQVVAASTKKGKEEED